MWTTCWKTNWVHLLKTHPKAIGAFFSMNLYGSIWVPWQTVFPTVFCCYGFQIFHKNYHQWSGPLELCLRDSPLAKSDSFSVSRPSWRLRMDLQHFLGFQFPFSKTDATDQAFAFSEFQLQRGRHKRMLHWSHDIENFEQGALLLACSFFRNTCLNFPNMFSHCTFSMDVKGKEPSWRNLIDWNYQHIVL